MNRDIQCIANETIYEGQLTVGNTQVAEATFQVGVSSCSEWIRHVLDPRHSVIFLDTNNSCPEQIINGALLNSGEAQLIRDILDAMRNVHFEQVGIITPYKAQVQHIIEQLSFPVEVSTVDRFQGRDKDCIIISLVRSNDQGELGVLLHDWHRLNVAFTRAKKKLILIGSRTTILNHPVMDKLRLVLEERKWIYCIELN